MDRPCRPTARTAASARGLTGLLAGLAALALPLLLVTACSDDPTGPADGADPGDQIPPDLGLLEVHPADGAADVLDRSLVWDGVVDPEGGPVTYRVEFGPENPPTTHLYTGGERSCPMALMLPGTTYHWRLTAMDAAGNEAASEVFSFTAAAQPAPGDFVPVAPGTFTMGSPAEESGRWDDEIPHQVTLTTAYWMQSTEVTNHQFAHLAQWALDQGLATIRYSAHDETFPVSLRDAMDGADAELLDLDAWDCEVEYVDGRLMAAADRRDHPVREVTWFGAAAFCDWLSLRHGLPRAYDHATWQCNGGQPYGAEGFRLPTEAEWEHACRAGTATPFSTGECLEAGVDANVNGNYPYPGCPQGQYRGETAPVASFRPNPWGLYDLHGNLHEWCNDWYTAYGGDATDPTGAPAVAVAGAPLAPLAGGDPDNPPGVTRVARGGTCQSSAVRSRAAKRWGLPPDDIYDQGMWLSFRVARSVLE